MNENAFVVEGMRVQTNLDNDVVRLVFEDMKGGERTVIIARDRLPRIAALLQPGSAKTPSSAKSPPLLRPWLQFESKGYDVRKRADGGATLTHHIETQTGHAVSVPLNLSPEEVADLLKHLKT